MTRPVLEVIGAATRIGRKSPVVVVDLAEVGLPLLDEPNHPRLRQYTHECPANSERDRHPGRRLRICRARSRRGRVGVRIAAGEAFITDHDLAVDGGLTPGRLTPRIERTNERRTERGLRCTRSDRRATTAQAENKEQATPAHEQETT